MENTKYWDQVNQPPKHALKVIQAGRLKGKSDINPQWRYKVLTEIFGPCGIGWKFDIDALWTEPGNDGQVFAFAKVFLFIKEDQEWSEPIPGIGGSMLIAKERTGLHSNDECFKMAVTDALSTACKMLGIAADVYMGLWDGAKYINVGKKSKSGPDELLFVDQANKLIALIESDQTVEDLKKRHTDNKPLIKTFPDDLKKKVMAAINARHEGIVKASNKPSEKNKPETSTEDPVEEREMPETQENQSDDKTGFPPDNEFPESPIDEAMRTAKEEKEKLQNPESKPGQVADLKAWLDEAEPDMRQGRLMQIQKDSFPSLNPKERKEILDYYKGMGNSQKPDF